MSLYVSMAIFALSMSASPGPVNILALSSGSTYGWSASQAFVLGASTGFTILLFVVALGLGEILVLFPDVERVASVLGSMFLIYLSIKLFLASEPVKSSNTVPLSFFHGATLQWINPKAWFACIAATSLFELIHFSSNLIIFLIMYFVICYASISCWALLGNSTATYLSRRKVQLLNQLLGGVIVSIVIVNFLEMELF